MRFGSKYRKQLRARLATEQGGKCCYCKRPFTEVGPTRATFEHKKPKRFGGKDLVKNLAVACWHCNQHRGQQIEKSRLFQTKAKSE